MTVQNFSFGVEARPGRYGPDGGSILTNCYAEEAPPDARVPFILYCRPGWEDFVTLSGAGAFRGGIDLGPLGIVSAGPVVSLVDGTGNATVIGGFAGQAPVHMARNRQAPNPEVALVSEGQRAIVQYNSTAQEYQINNIADTDLPPPVGVVSIGGYFVFIIADGRYFWTAIDAGTDIDALDFASAEANPDGLVGIAVRQQEIVLAGQKTIEFHALTGSDNTFDRVPQTTSQIGCLSGSALKTLNGIPIFPASDATVRLINGYAPERISTHDVERDIDALEDKSSLTAFTFQMHGHQFYVLNSPEWTWVCDLLTRFWFKWGSYGLPRWRAQGMVEVGGKKIIGAYDSTKLYEFDVDAQTEAGEHLLWEMISGPLSAYPGRIELNAFYFSGIPGSGLNSSDPHASDPEIMVSVSKDDGKTFGTEKKAKVGTIGQRNTRIRLPGFGTSREQGFRVKASMSAPVMRAWTGSAADVQVVDP